MRTSGPRDQALQSYRHPGWSRFTLIGTSGYLPSAVDPGASRRPTGRFPIATGPARSATGPTPQTCLSVGTRGAQDEPTARSAPTAKNPAPTAASRSAATVPQVAPGPPIELAPPPDPGGGGTLPPRGQCRHGLCVATQRSRASMCLAARTPFGASVKTDRTSSAADGAVEDVDHGGSVRVYHGTNRLTEDDFCAGARLHKDVV